jgi:hypothetical protein
MLAIKSQMLSGWTHTVQSKHKLTTTELIFQLMWTKSMLKVHSLLSLQIKNVGLEQFKEQQHIEPLFIERLLFIELQLFLWLQ